MADASIVSGPPSLQSSMPTPAPQTTSVEPVVPPGIPTVQVPITAAPSKPASKSVTVQVNSAIIVVSFLASLIVSIQPQLNAAIIANFQQNPDLGVALVTVLSSLIALFNILIRIYKTGQPITH